MDYVTLGKSGVKVSRIAMGCMTLGREAGETESRRMIEIALDSGVNLFDTANSYAGGRSEEIVGTALKERRNDVVLATKVFNPMGKGPNDQGASRYHILRSVDESLRRLKTDRIDLYQLHRFDPEVPPEETLRAMDDLVRWGKVVYIGCSNFSARQLKDAMDLSRGLGLYSFVSVQPMYNLLKREIETDLLPYCSEKGLGVISYNPLAGGFLTGKYQTLSQLPSGTRLGDLESYQKRYLSDESLRLTSRVLEAAQKRGVNPIALSIAWVASHPAVTSTLIGARNEAQLKETLALANMKMSPEERDQLTREVWG